jgi:hypothetical protein
LRPRLPQPNQAVLLGVLRALVRTARLRTRSVAFSAKQKVMFFPSNGART